MDEDVSDAFASKIKLRDVTRVMRSIIDMSTTSITFESVIEIAYTLNSIAETLRRSRTITWSERNLLLVETTQSFGDT